MDRLSDLFQQWLAAFQAMQVASSEADVAKAHRTLGEIEAKMVDAPAEGMEGLFVKLGLHCFLNEHADAASVQSDSAYRDLVRLTGQDPAVEIASGSNELRPEGRAGCRPQADVGRRATGRSFSPTRRPTWHASSASHWRGGPLP